MWLITYKIKQFFWEYLFQENVSGAFSIQFYVILFIFMSLVQYLYGMRRNRNRAQKFAVLIQKKLKQYFQNIGDGQGELLSNFNNINEYKIYCTKNAQTFYCLITILLKKRQNFIYMWLIKWIKRQGDRVTFDIPVKMPKKLPVIFAILKQKKMNSLNKDQTPDLVNLCRTIKSDILNKNFTILAENYDIFNSIFTENMMEKINDIQKDLVLMHITDHKCYSDYPMKIRATMLLSSSFEKDIQNYFVLIDLLMQIVERVQNTSIQQSVIKQIENTRNKIDL